MLKLVCFFVFSFGITVYVQMFW